MDPAQPHPPTPIQSGPATGAQNIAPHLQEAYNRVMSTPVASQQPKVVTPPPAPPAPLQPKPAAGGLAPQVFSPPIPAHQNIPTPFHPESPFHTTVAQEEKKVISYGSSASPTHVGNEKPLAAVKKASVPTGVVIIVALVFFVAYTFFWLVFFKFPIPFLQ